MSPTPTPTPIGARPTRVERAPHDDRSREFHITGRSGAIPAIYRWTGRTNGPPACSSSVDTLD